MPPLIDGTVSYYGEPAIHDDSIYGARPRYWVALIVSSIWALTTVLFRLVESAQ